MDFNATIDLIIKDLKEASDIIDDLKKYPGVPALQVELAKSKCRSAADVIALLKNLETAVPVVKASVPDKEPEPARKGITIPEKQVKSVQPQAEKKRDIITDHPSSVRPIQKEEPAVSVNKIQDNSILADKFQAPAELYSETSSGIKAERDLSDRLKAKHFKSLSDAIGISDKFLFIGSIFDGDKEAYGRVLAQLDNAGTLDDARTIIEDYIGEKPESDAVTQLLELVKLKIESNE
jgi:hypothetical protein